jgi:transaldolase
MDASSLSPEDIVEFFDERGYRDLFPDWSPTDIETVAADGKIPKYERWENHFARGEMGLDALMSISGLYSFDTDQKAMDERIKSML